MFCDTISAWKNKKAAQQSAKVASCLLAKIQELASQTNIARCVTRMENFVTKVIYRDLSTSVTKVCARVV